MYSTTRNIRIKCENNGTPGNLFEASPHQFPTRLQSAQIPPLSTPIKPYLHLISPVATALYQTLCGVSLRTVPPHSTVRPSK